MKWCSCDTYSPGDFDRCQWCHKPLNAGTDPVVERVLFSGPIPPSTTPPPLSQRRLLDKAAGRDSDQRRRQPPKKQMTLHGQRTADARVVTTPSSSVGPANAYSLGAKSPNLRQAGLSPQARNAAMLPRLSESAREEPTPREIRCAIGLVQDWIGGWRIGFRCVETGEYLGQFPSEPLPCDPCQTAWSVLLESLIEDFAERMGTEGWTITYEPDTTGFGSVRLIARRSAPTREHAGQVFRLHR